jgi:preprotein translocase subunit SecA
VIYVQRNELLDADDITETIVGMRGDVLRETVETHVPPDTVEEQWDVPGLTRALDSEFNVKAPIDEWMQNDAELDSARIAERVFKIANDDYNAKFANVEPRLLHQYERAVMLQAIDSHWREHLAALDYLRQGIHLRGYAQKQPKQEYKREAFELFSQMLDSIKRQVTQILINVQVQSQEQVEAAEKAAEEAATRAAQNVQYHHADYDEALAAADKAAEEAAAAPFVREGVKIGRNDPCYCGSGKKYKHCHGKLS